MMTASHSILVVEDNLDLLNLLRINLEDQGYRVHTVENGDAAIEKFNEVNPDLLILDIMLPGRDGFDVCKAIRSEHPAVPIMMLTARAEEVDKVLGLELGADDYMTKPFSIREFLARVKAILRRADLSEETHSESEILDFDELRVDVSRRKVTCKDDVVELTEKEYDLLLIFFRNPGKTYSREDLLNAVWGYHYEGYTHTVNSHINRLRNKIEEDPSDPHYIRTVWGVGYRFADRDESLNHA